MDMTSYFVLRSAPQGRWGDARSTGLALTQGEAQQPARSPGQSPGVSLWAQAQADSRKFWPYPSAQTLWGREGGGKGNLR